MTEVKYPLADPFQLSSEEVAKHFQTDVIKGLSDLESTERNEKFGLNQYKGQKQKSLFLIFIQQFTNPIVYLLVGGIAVSLYFNDKAEAIAIFLVILINGVIGFLMEFQAKRSMKALREMEVIKSKVIRNGKMQEISSERITAGDIVWIEAGDVVPGDGRIIESNQLMCDESSLTGESLPVEKKTEQLEKETGLADQVNMIFKGSSVIKGNGKAIITGIGSHTQLGNITSLVEGSEETATPLDKKLNSLTKKLIWLTLVIMVVFVVSGFIQKKELHTIIETSIALAVAAIPEGLPIVATVALAYGMVLMAKRNAIVKKLSSVETLGGVNVILTDKTGTLTENKIYVNTFSFPTEKTEVDMKEKEVKLSIGDLKESKENYEKLLLISALCNNATVETIGDEKKESGDPIEIALHHLFNASGGNWQEITLQYPRTAEQPFDSDTKTMGTLHRKGDVDFVAAKGSVEELLDACTSILKKGQKETLNEESKKALLEESEKLSENGLRVLAFAYKEEKNISKDAIVKELVFTALVGFLDPPRLDIKGAILSCKEAGIKVVMITGDHPKTALNIAEKTGLADAENRNVLAGNTIPTTDSLMEKWKDKILQTTVFARATPKQKLEIAEIYQKEGYIVAMTGDGINDAPALKKADVGIAMGLRGTQVAKETADIVLKDDSFVSIVDAVAHGREIFQNIQNFVIYLISCNMSEILVVTFLGFISPESTLLPLQILFLNMVTDVFPALALGVGKGDPNVMKNPPRDPQLGIIVGKQWIEIVVYSSLITLCIVAGVLYSQFYIQTGPKIENNIAFVGLTFAQLFHVFNMASAKTSFFNNDVTRNKYVWLALVMCTGFLVLAYLITPVKTILGLQTLTFNHWLICVLIGLVPLVLIQPVKRLFMKNS